MNALGFNYRISDLNCALGISQLSSVRKFLNRRKIIAKNYNKLFKNLDNIYLPIVKENCVHSYHLSPLIIDFEKLKLSKKIFFEKMYKLGILLQVHYMPICRQLYYKKKYNYNYKNFPVAEKFYSQEVSMPIYYGLSNKEAKYIFDSLKLVIEKKI